VLDVFDSHVFGDDFVVLWENESNFAFFLVNEYLEQIYKFPGMGDKKSFVSAFKNVEVSLSICDLSFNIPYNWLPESLKARWCLLLVIKFDFNQLFGRMGDQFASLVFGFHVEHTFAPNCVRLEQLAIFKGFFSVGFGDGYRVLELDLLVLGIFLGRLFVEVQVWRQSRVQNLSTDLWLLLLLCVISLVFVLAVLLQLLLFLHYKIFILIA
jgi:hypothetical protein